MSVASFRQLLARRSGRKPRSGSVIKELEQMCEKARSIRRRAAAAAAAAAVRSVAASVRPSVFISRRAAAATVVAV